MREGCDAVIPGMEVGAPTRIDFFVAYMVLYMQQRNAECGKRRCVRSCVNVRCSATYSLYSYCIIGQAGLENEAIAFLSPLWNFYGVQKMGKGEIVGIIVQIKVPMSIMYC